MFKKKMPPNLDQRMLSGAEQSHVTKILETSWKTIAPFWPLKNLVAVNPLQGFEDCAIEDALAKGSVLFQNTNMPIPMQKINRISIKWLQVFFDQGQATIPMPLRNQGFYTAWKTLAVFDPQIHEHNHDDKDFLRHLPESAQVAVLHCLEYLAIPEKDRALFVTLMLTTLPGWASHIKYRTHWAENSPKDHPISSADYVAFRLILTCILWGKNATELLDLYHTATEQQKTAPNPFIAIQAAEQTYLSDLLPQLYGALAKKIPEPQAQWVFCIDVRSESIRRFLEAQGPYETFGFSGFFGIPARILNKTTHESHASCPVLMKPLHTITESPPPQYCAQDVNGYAIVSILKGLFQSLKYNVSPAFVWVEWIGLPAGLWMLLKTVSPIFAISSRNRWIQWIRPAHAPIPCLEPISFSSQCFYAESGLRAIGLIQNFSPVVVLCGHGSVTQNNAYASALDCGACGGQHGASNARILAKILNREKIRTYLGEKGIFIPVSTHFIAAEHNTTADEIAFYPESMDPEILKKIGCLQEDFKKAGQKNSQKRLKTMGFSVDLVAGAKQTKRRSMDWAQIRAEWGLARNASFIAAPRTLTQDIDLQGRAFLHSYDYLQDPDGAILEGILTAPMIVAQWISSQYFFSTLDPVAYGAGSKVTKNVTGKIGVMQGNASDLMTGLPLQSVYKNDREAYHEPVRLLLIVYAPVKVMDFIIAKQALLQKLFGNGWVNVLCIDPEQGGQNYFLNRDLTWKNAL